MFKNLIFINLHNLCYDFPAKAIMNICTNHKRFLKFLFELCDHWLAFANYMSIIIKWKCQDVVYMTPSFDLPVLNTMI